MLDQRLAQAIQRILASDDSGFPVTNTLKRLVDEYGIGTIRGKSVHFTDNERAEMRSQLTAKGYSVEKADLAAIERHQRLSFTPNEKAGGESVKKNRVSIKALGGQPLLLASKEINLPERAHIDVEWTAVADQIGHKCVMVVENYENFNLIHKTRFNFCEECKSPLVVYRGDVNESRVDYVLDFLRHIHLPVLAFVDADPAGVAIASSLPGLFGVVTPSKAQLESQLMHGTARKDLFYSQYPVYGSMLDGLKTTHSCYPLWNLISKYKACVVQERWINSEAICSILSD